MSYLVLDMEFNQFYYKGIVDQEVIEFGATEIIDESINYYHSLIRPYNRLNKRISDLTGIKDSDLKKSPLFNSFMNGLFKRLNSKTYILITWSDSDIRVLVNQLMKHKLPTNWIEGYIDLQEVLVKEYKLSKTPSLKNAISMFNMEWVGNEHHAQYDSFNTARLFFSIKDSVNINPYIKNNFLDINIVKTDKNNGLVLTRSASKIFEEIINEVYKTEGEYKWSKILRSDRFRNFLYLKNIDLEYLTLFENYFTEYVLQIEELNK